MTLTKILSCCFVVAAVAVQAQAPVDDPCAAGQAAFAEHDYIGAEPLLEQCLERQGESLELLVPLTMIAVFQGEPEKAVRHGERAVALAPEDANVLFWYGRALAAAGDLEGAAQQWEAGLAIDVNHVGILRNLAALSMQQGNTAKAYNLLAQLRLQGIDDAWIHRVLSELSYRKGLWRQAASHFRDVVRREGENEQNLGELGELYIRAGQSEQAVEVFRRAVAIAPSSGTYGGLGAAWFAMEEVDSAVVYLREAVELDPENARSRFNLANALEIRGDSEEAGEHFAAYVEQVPQDPMGHFNYGVHLEATGEPQRALTEVEEAVRLDPEYLEAQVVLAQMYEELGRTDDALGTIEALARLDPEAAAELEQWRRRLLGQEQETSSALAEGKVHLLHITTDDPQARRLIEEGLAAGEDFGTLATRFSGGNTAVRGGDIGWVDPTQMVGALRAAIEALEPGETSPPVEAGGLTHFFKRIR